MANHFNGVAVRHCRQFDQDSGEPVCSYLQDLKQIYLWFRGCDDINRASVTLPQHYVLPNRSRTLVCHDMDNGYHEDR